MQIKPKKVVVLGGGTGLSVLLRGLKRQNVDITAVVTVADDGGSTGRIRQELDIPAPGDIRNVLAALSEVEPLFEEMFQYRFADETVGQLSGHSLGNLILAAMSDIMGDFATGIREMSKVLNVKGEVLPSTNRNVTLNAEMCDGSIVSGESKITAAGKKIKRVFLTPENIQPLYRTEKAIEDADLIIIGPGSLYTSIMPNLIVPKLKKALLNATARKIYICNIMTQPGETDNYTASDHVKAIRAHTSYNFIDTIFVTEHFLQKEVLQKYFELNSCPVTVDLEKLEDMNLVTIKDDFISIEDEIVRHNASKISQTLYEILSKD